MYIYMYICKCSYACMQHPNEIAMAPAVIDWTYTTFKLSIVIYICIYVYVNIYTHTYIYTHICVHVHACKSTKSPWLLLWLIGPMPPISWILLYICTFCVYINVYIYICVYTYIYLQIHVCSTPTKSQWLLLWLIGLMPPISWI